MGFPTPIDNFGLYFPNRMMNQQVLPFFLIRWSRTAKQYLPVSQTSSLIRALGGCRHYRPAGWDSIPSVARSQPCTHIYPSKWSVFSHWPLKCLWKQLPWPPFLLSYTSNFQQQSVYKQVDSQIGLVSRSWLIFYSDLTSEGFDFKSQYFQKLPSSICKSLWGKKAPKKLQ